MAKSKTIKEENINVQETAVVEEEKSKQIIEEQQEQKQETKNEIKKSGVKKMCLTTDIPYTTEPKNNMSVAGFLKKGSTHVILDEIDSGEYGKFWQIGYNKFVNKDWNVIVIDV